MIMPTLNRCAASPLLASSRPISSEVSWKLSVLTHAFPNDLTTKPIASQIIVPFKKCLGSLALDHTFRNRLSAETHLFSVAERCMFQYLTFVNFLLHTFAFCKLYFPVCMDAQNPLYLI